MFEPMMAVCQMHHFDVVGIEAVIVDQLFSQYQRLRRANRQDVDLALQALEAVAIRIEQTHRNSG